MCNCFRFGAKHIVIDGIPQFRIGDRVQLIDKHPHNGLSLPPWFDNRPLYATVTGEGSNFKVKFDEDITKAEGTWFDHWTTDLDDYGWDLKRFNWIEYVK